MGRPGFTLVTNDRTAPLLTFSGAGLGLERFPAGTQVVYGAEPVVSGDPASLVDQSLETPVDSAPLEARLAGVRRLVIVVADHDRPRPPMRFDVRRTVVERVLETAARADVDDVRIITASGLAPRWSDRRVLDVLGERIASSFIPDGLVASHDVTAADLVTVGDVAGGPVRVHPHVAAAELVVLVDVVDGPSHPDAALANLADVETLNRVRGLDADETALEALADVLLARLDVVGVAAVLSPPRLGRQLSFANKREWEWRLADQLALAGARQVLAGLPRQGADRLYRGIRADHGLADLIGGGWREVSRQARQVWTAANTVSVPHPADVLVAPVWGPLLGADRPEGNPLRAFHHALVDRGPGTSDGVVRRDGVLLALHPLRPLFSQRESAAADLFAGLRDSVDPRDVRDRLERRAIEDEWSTTLYRDHQASHPLRHFHEFYRASRAASHVAEVIWVGADRQSAALLGHRAATTCADAMEMVADRIGPAPRITVLRGPGPVLPRVAT